MHIAALSALFEFGNPDSTTVSGDYSEAVAAVERALIEVNTDPEAGIVHLRAALTALREHGPRLAGDGEALALRSMAELALARALLSRGDHEGAAAIVDATLIGLADAELPIAELGPSLGALVEERRELLERRGSARLRVACSVPCSVYVDERVRDEAAESGLHLPLGEHRVWIEGPGTAPLRTTLTLAEADRALTIAYPEPSAPAPVAQPSETLGDRIDPPLGGRSRIAPRWAEATTLALGGAALAAGAVLWALDSRCPGGVDPRQDAADCPQLYDTRAAGIALVAAGGLASLTGGVLLVVDEARAGDRRGREVALVWTRRF